MRKPVAVPFLVALFSFFAMMAAAQHDIAHVLTAVFGIVVTLHMHARRFR